MEIICTIDKRFKWLKKNDMKRTIIALCFLSLFVSVNAQQKKKATKPSAAKANTERTTVLKGINEQNYGVVIEYTNNIVSCLNKQQKEIADRQEYYTTWYNYFVKNQSGSKNKVIYSIYISYDLTKNNARCIKGNAPDIMEAGDIVFYDENYKTLAETFQKIALIWNDMGSFSKPNIPTLEIGKKYCLELESLFDTYNKTREKLSARNKQLQKQLFPYSVAKSPYKVAYTNLYNDMDAIKEFISLCSASDNLNSTAIKNSLAELEGPITQHLLYANDNQTPSNYREFYEMASKYVVASSKAKVNGKGLQAKDIEQLWSNYNTYLIPIYNGSMN